MYAEVLFVVRDLKDSVAEHEDTGMCLNVGTWLPDRARSYDGGRAPLSRCVPAFGGVFQDDDAEWRGGGLNFLIA
jgi:hypothetical protein